jgi:hypothetical protein
MNLFAFVAVVQMMGKKSLRHCAPLSGQQRAKSRPRWRHRFETGQKTRTIHGGSALPGEFRKLRHEAGR